MRAYCAREPRISLSAVNFLHCHLVDAVSHRPRFTAQRCASALIADDSGRSVSVVCLSQVTVVLKRLDVSNCFWQHTESYPHYAMLARDVKAQGPCGLEAKSFGLSLGLTLSGLGLDLGLMASGLGLIEIGLVASNIYSAHEIN